LVGELVDVRRHRAARAAPLGPEVDEHGHVALEYGGFPGAVGDVEGVAHGGGRFVCEKGGGGGGGGRHGGRGWGGGAGGDGGGGGEYGARTERRPPPERRVRRVCGSARVQPESCARSCAAATATSVESSSASSSAPASGVAPETGAAALSASCAGVSSSNTEL